MSQLRFVPINQTVVVKKEKIEAPPPTPLPTPQKRRNVDDSGQQSAYSKKRRNAGNHNINELAAVLGAEIERSASMASTVSLNWEDHQDSGRRCDSDRFYLKSLLHFFERLDLPRKLIVRAKIEELLKEEVYNM